MSTDELKPRETEEIEMTKRAEAATNRQTPIRAERAEHEALDEIYAHFSHINDLLEMARSELMNLSPSRLSPDDFDLVFELMEQCDLLATRAIEVGSKARAIHGR